MELKTLLDVPRQAPFRPFDLHAEGRVVREDHPEQVFISPDKETVIVAGMEGGLAILDLDHIRRLSLVPRRRSKATGQT